MFDENNNFEINDNEEQVINEEVPVKEYEFNNYFPESYYKKQELRRLGVIIGIPTIFLSVIGYLWSIAYLFLTINLIIFIKPLY